MISLDDTHDLGLQSWLESANEADCDFPVQNLPFGRFRRADDVAWHLGVAIGDQVLDLQRVHLVDSNDMKRLLQLGPDARRALRHALSMGLRRGSGNEAAFRAALLPMATV
jgi:fumarylacetoacetase